LAIDPAKARGAPLNEFSRNSKRDDETAARFQRDWRCRAAADRRSMQARHFLHLLRVSLCGLVFVVAVSGAQAREVTVQEAVAKAQQETNGKVLSVQALTIGKRKLYRIKVLTLDGQVRVVQIPADQ
jgi:uncharacterized membrane protein YkoI